MNQASIPPSQYGPVRARGRRALLAAAIGATLAVPFAGAHAQAVSAAAYPSKPVRIIVGFAAGTGPDIVARLLAQKLSEGWGNHGVIVDNKPGAGGLIAAGEAARATADGYTLMLGETGQLSIAPSSYNKLPYDPAKDFVPVSQVVTSDFALLINPQKVPSRNVKDFVSWTQQQKGLFLATFGAGTPGHFGAFMFGDAVKLKPEPVHYRSTADALGGLFSGDVQGVFASVGLAAPQVKSGKLLALGTTGATRTHALPDVPTIKEQGYANLEFSSWFGIVAPANTPAPIVARLSADIVKAVQSPDGKARLEEAGFKVTGTGAAEFARIIAADTVTWGKAVAATGFKAD
ncbi:MAG: tripartite tricarboxylate transporter substrate binding protein [Acidovorax sp.]|jgi:tripartite-type tricarboxylate transporter receptor subunit TctC|uniref:Bug family tripartite tricarboxylate transporter substrate binding protein n=1 Tax=Acidovorax sp. TaxID=1872122 RepID=UPI002625B40C|nr:tripartite tricarboxylate transporter substrate binding protein [Acidovorax sp.]MDH4424991.1 tripartite tricarboxylate transporter substrate binding protein [Acidovorax sp.]MDH4447390.1 tripartite tricarboxylate transporter substrate binding protein [Acidovorax sp.]